MKAQVKVKPDKDQETISLLMAREESIKNQLSVCQIELNKELTGKISQKTLVSNSCVPGLAKNRMGTLELCLANIFFARQRLEVGAYGFCQDCGRPIPTERLMIIPEARRCMECQMAYV